MVNVGDNVTSGPLPQSQQVEYRYLRVEPSGTGGELVDPRTGDGYRKLVDDAAIDGWRFVQAIPAGTASGAFDLVFERQVRYPVLVLGHVPKTAGSSLTSMLVRYLERVVGLPPSHWLQYGAAIPYNDLRPLRQLNAKVRLVTGHFGTPHYQLLLRSDAMVLVSLRDPFERFISAIEHEHRDAVACPPDAPQETLDRYARLRDGIGRLHAARGDDRGSRLALEGLRRDSISIREFLLFAGRHVAGAWIGSDEVDELGRRLVAAADDPKKAAEVIGGSIRENVHPKPAFAAFTERERAVLRAAFEEVFDDECGLVRSVEREVPHLFSPAAWAAFLGCLWRKPGLGGA